MFHYRSIFLGAALVIAGAASALAQTAKIAVIQLPSAEAGDYAAMLGYAEEAKSSGAIMAIFPESAAFGWLNPAVFTASTDIPGPVSDPFSKIAVETGLWIAAGLAEKAPGQGTSPDIHRAFDSGIIVNPEGEIVLHHRKYQVLQNAFDNAVCEEYFNEEKCAYSQGDVSDITVVQTPFGRTSLIVCADAYTYDTTALDAVKAQQPELVIVPWGVGAKEAGDCSQDWANATKYAADAAKYVETATFIGANVIGERPYGNLRPAVYCGLSGFAHADGTIGGVAADDQTVTLFDIPLVN